VENIGWRHAIRFSANSVNDTVPAEVSKCGLTELSFSKVLHSHYSLSGSID